MGPRPLGRGWDAAKTVVDALLLASMGPRPLGRGWLLHAVHVLLPLMRFNGAATARSRMVISPLSFVLGIGASMGPRPLGRGWRLHARRLQGEAVMLQWGRDR